MPRVPGFEHGLQFLTDPYRFIGRQCALHRSDVVQARLMMQPTLCMTGPLAAELFYDKDRFRRAGGAPEPVCATLFGKGGVQSLDGEDHRHRKQFFMAATSCESHQALLQAAEAQWHRLLPGWAGRERLSLYGMAQDWLARTAFAWAGIEVPDAQVPQRRRDLVALFDRAALGVVPHLQSRAARGRAEAWLSELIEYARQGHGPFPEGSPAQAAAQLTGRDGRLLPARTAAVELLNLVRPITAVSVFVVLAAHALHSHPGWRRPLQGSNDGQALRRAFVQEVRRFYPFFPVLAARTCRAFSWRGLQFPDDVRVMLDLYGTNHDPRAWPEPQVFRPERFLGHTHGLFAFIPQGGATAADHHRCPGEDFTVALMMLSLRLLGSVSYELPAQDLAIDMRRMPAVPRDRLLIANLRTP